MEIRELSKDEIRLVYDTHMKDDFPPSELKPLRMILHAVKKQRYLCFGAFQSDEIIGYAFVAFVPGAKERTYLLDYFAVRKEMRGQGSGSKILPAVSAALPKARGMVLEVEDPATAGTAEEKEVREKRIRFYLRCGAVDTQVNAWLFGVEYKLLELPTGTATPHAPEEVRKLYKELLQGLVPRLLLRRNLIIRE